MDRGGFLIGGIGADIADVRVGQGNDLASIGGVGQNLLVTRHGGIEHHLTGNPPFNTDRCTPKQAAVFQGQ